MPDSDILIAGAGPAGCAAAYDLAQAGKRVLLLDRRTFPRPKACACGLTRKTLKALRYSVDPVVERVCHEIVLQQRSEDPTHREVRVRTRNPICAMAVRERFDAFCLQQTLASGRDGGSVTLRKIETILDLREDADGIELDIATAEGSETLRTPILIGADGSNGQTRRMAARLLDPRPLTLDPDWYSRGFALEATISYTELPNILPGGDAPLDLVFDFAPLPGGYGWLFPKGDHINIGVGAFAPPDETRDKPGAPFVTASSSRVGSGDNANLKQVTRALLNNYCLQKLGVPAPAAVTGQALGMGGHLYTPRGRVLLTGDAAGLVDPLTGEGIHSALVSGQAAAAAILESLRPGAPGPDSRTRVSTVSEAYAKLLAPLQQTLAFSHRAARAFYAEPERGFRVMRTPLLRGLVLKTYADGLPYTNLLNRLARIVA